MTVTATEPKYTAEQLAEYQNKKVVVVVNLPEPNEKGEGAVEWEGTVQAGNTLGLLLKPKGQVQFKLINRETIEDIRLVQDKSATIKRSKLQPVKIGQARRHLLERHAATLTAVNSMTEEQAQEVHDGIDHEVADLGHVHVAEGESTEESDATDGE